MLRAQHQGVKRLTGQLGVRIMVWVGTSLPTCGVVFPWASTIKIGRGSD